MKIEKLVISFADKSKIKLFEQNKTYNFREKTLITSNGVNSRGKTTLIRFILLSLGFNIPLTDGMIGQDFKTTIEFNDQNINYRVRREGDKIEVYRNNILINNVGNMYLLNMFNLSSFEDLDNILGCFYIDQEKGWTLLNRGRIIGKKKFNIEKFISFINKLTDTYDLIKENENIEMENRKIKILEDINSLKNEMENIEDINQLEEITEINRKVSLLNSQILSLKSDKKALENLQNDHEKFIKRLELLELKIKINSEIFPITKENVIGFDVDDNFIDLEIEDIDNQINKLTRDRQHLDKKLKYFQERTSINGIDKIISKISISDYNYAEIITKKNKNFETKRINTKYIKEALEKSIDEIWKIMFPILKKLEVSAEYFDKKIIFRNRLSGISGTQLHKLTFSLKLSLLIFIKNKINIEVPFIIDSPMSGEVNKETANKMMELACEYLEENQIIISSVYDDFSILFNEIIYLDKNGVLGNIDNFLLNETK